MNNDLISREALRKEIINKSYREGEHDWLLRCDVFEALANAPAVDTSERETEAYKKGFVDGMIRATELSNDVLEKLARGGVE